MKNQIMELVAWSLILMLVPLHAGAQGFEARKGDKEGDLPYRLLKPKNYSESKKYPLVLFLHGAGEGGTDNGNQLKHVVQVFANPAVMDKYPCFVAAPQSPLGVKWVDTPWGNPSHTMPGKPSPSMAGALKICDELMKEFKIDKDRVYVIGLSMGGYGTWDALMRRPELFAAGVPICGGADDTKAKLIKHIPVWVFHGSADPTVPVTRSRNIVEALKKEGAEPKYTEFPGMGHKSWGPAISTPELLPWLFEQKRKSSKPIAKKQSDVAAKDDREIREWTSRKGGKVQARLIRTTDLAYKAILKTEDDKNVAILISDLSPADQEYIESQK